jgi:hypothetical protein
VVTTFVAGLRRNRISAAFVLEGAMNGQGFLTYLETILVPSLRAGGIVVIDNLTRASLAMMNMPNPQ